MFIVKNYLVTPKKMKYFFKVKHTPNVGFRGGFAPPAPKYLHVDVIVAGHGQGTHRAILPKLLSILFILYFKYLGILLLLLTTKFPL